MLKALARNGLLGQFQCLSIRPGSAHAKGKKCMSIGPLGSELWLFKEGNRQIGPKIGANPFSSSHNSGLSSAKVLNQLECRPIFYPATHEFISQQKSNMKNQQIKTTNIHISNNAGFLTNQ